MKKIFLIIITALIGSISFGQKGVGIGADVPVARLHVTDSSVLFTAAGDTIASTGNLRFTDTTRVMLWNANRALFRAGYLDSFSLNPNYIKPYTFAAGYLTQPNGIYSSAFGALTVAGGEASAAFGSGTEATGANCMAFGYNSGASSGASFASGYGCFASLYGTAMGYQSSTSSGKYSSVFGEGKASHDYATAFGASSVGQQFGTSMGRITTVFGNSYDGTALNDSTTTNGYYAVSMGHATWSPSYACLTLGRWNKRFETSKTAEWVTTDPVIIVGGGKGNTIQTRTNILEFLKNGNLTITGTFNHASDIRLKKDITPLNNCLQKITSLAGYNYNWKSELLDNEKQSGILAQDVEKLMPELVTQNMKGDKAVNYSGLIPYLIEAIKELNTQTEDTDALTAEYNVLKAHHDALVKRVELIEKLVK